MFKKEPIEFIFFFGFFTYLFMKTNKNKNYLDKNFQIGDKVKLSINQKLKTAYILEYNNNNNTYSLETGKKHPTKNMIHKNVNIALIHEFKQVV
tara:strand:- start:32 stop:313 length:282 start_codon:yes stop_codon:yes gene_type:complete